jgi:hypothetical protein
MTISLITFPKFKLTLGVTEYENVKLKYAKVIRNENGFDVATIILNDTSLVPDTVTAGTAVQLEVGEKGSAYPTNPMFKGVCKFPVTELSKEPSLTLSCVGAGYGLGQMICGSEYGVQSVNPTVKTIATIIGNANYGIVPQYVNRVFGAGASGDSGFDYDAATRVSDTGTDPDINYISFPYKPANQCLNDLCDLVTALRAGSAGSHWIVTTDDMLHEKQVGVTQTGWTLYYGNSQANATLTYGESYDLANIESLGPEANYIIYYGKWRRPSNGDGVTENTSALWSAMDADTTLSDDAVNYIVNSYSVKMLRNNAVGSVTGGWYPSGRNAAWDFSGFTDFNVPTLNFYILRHCPGAWSNFYVYLETDLGGGAFGYGYTDLTSDVSADDQWVHFSLPVGPYYNVPERFTDFKWYGDGNLDWSQVDAIRFRWQCNQNDYVCVDGLYFGDVDLCRVAYDSSISPYSMRLITDNIGKDDSLIAADDSGIMAQLAYAELLRSSATSNAGYVKLKGVIPEALPGQYFYLQADMRATKIVHEIDGTGFHTTPYLTNDLLNGRARMRYEDLNKVYADIRPEFQDRQATSIKAGNVDWRITRLAVDYA